MLELLSDIHTHLMTPERFFLAVGALVLVSVAGLVTGPQYGNASPLYWLFADKVLGGIGARLNRPNRKNRDLVLRALIVLIFGLALAAFVAGVFERLVLRFPFYNITEIFLLAPALTAGSVWFALLRLYFALKEKKVGKGEYYTIARSARVNLSVSDDYGITRVGMGLAARLFDKGLVGPVFWYLIAGLPGAYIYAGLNALAWRFGRDGQGGMFGKTFWAMEKLLGYVPGLLAGLLVALGSVLTPTAAPMRPLTALMHGKNRAPYEEGGPALTAMAYALKVSLGGAVQDIDGAPVKRAWVGPEKATAQLGEGHLRRALYLSLMAHVLLLASLMGAAVWAGAF